MDSRFQKADKANTLNLYTSMCSTSIWCYITVLKSNFALKGVTFKMYEVVALIISTHIQKRYYRCLSTKYTFHFIFIFFPHHIFPIEMPPLFATNMSSHLTVAYIEPTLLK